MTITWRISASCLSSCGASRASTCTISPTHALLQTRCVPLARVRMRPLPRFRPHFSDAHQRPPAFARAILSLSLSLPLSLSLLVMRCVAFSFRGMALLPPRAQVMLGDEYDLRCDVFSFALTCWEMVACDVPFANYSSRQAAHLISQGLRPTVPPHCPEWLAMLMVACNAHVPVARPTFATVSALFQSATIDSDGLTEGIDKCDAPRSVPHLASLPRTPSPRSVCHRPLRSHQSLVVAACLA